MIPEADRKYEIILMVKFVIAGLVWENIQCFSKQEVKSIERFKRFHAQAPH